MSAEVAEAEPRQLSDKFMLAELRDFANRNISFRRLKVDRVEIDVTEGEIIENADEPIDDVSLEYYFSAVRHRVPVDVNEIRPEADRLPQPHSYTIFKLGTVAMVEQTSLPFHIFQQAKDDGMVSNDTNPGSEKFGIYHRLEFVISTNEHWLRAAESYEYVDSDGDTISEATTDVVDESDDDDLSESDRELIMAERKQKEKEFKTWIKANGLVSLDHELADDQHDEHLKMAYQVFRGLKKSLSVYSQ